MELSDFNADPGKKGCIGKPAVNAPELTKEAMPDGKYIYTKDLGYIDEDGFVYMPGRKDDIIQFGGIMSSPEEK